MKKQTGLGNVVRLLAAVVVSLGLLALALRGVSLRAMGQALGNADYRYLAIGIVLYLLVQLIRGVRWRILLEPVGRFGLWQVMPSLLMGYFSNYLLPAKTGELVRAAVMGTRGGVSRSSVLASIVVEKLFDLLSLIVILLGALVFLPLPGWADLLEELAVGPFVLLILALTLVAYRTDWTVRVTEQALGRVSPRLARAIVARLRRFADGFRYQNARSLLAAGLVTAVQWTTTITLFVIIGRALRLDVPVQASMLMALLVNLASFVPSLPGRVGLWEFVGTAVLVPFGVDPATAVAFPLLLRVTHLTPLLIGYVLLSREGLRLMLVGGQQS